MTNYQVDGFVSIPNSFCCVLLKANFTVLCNPSFSLLSVVNVPSE